MSLRKESQERILKNMMFYRQRRNDAIERAIAKETDEIRQQVEQGKLSLFHGEARIRFYIQSACSDYAEFKHDYSEELVNLWKQSKK